MKTIFITGTNTGVGKTVLTGLLLAHLRHRGRKALAIKPFCSGGRGDANLLRTLQDGELSLEEINPFFFPEPVAPLVAAREHRRLISQEEVLDHIHRIGQRCELLLIEGAGGLLAPLGENYTALDLIAALNCDVLVAARNQLGTINHTMLTVSALRNVLGIGARTPRPRVSIEANQPKHADEASALLRVVLMNARVTDPSCASNAAVLSELLAPVPLVSIPYLGVRCRAAAAIRSHAARLGRTLGRLV